MIVPAVDADGNRARFQRRQELGGITLALQHDVRDEPPPPHY